ncbi:hypothetical protein WS72_11540 [Burkholderia savannae]|uniref:HipA-like kinase domain-containing protein n=1 Tax=Burkholderia savannae TaxID=1637837 RepID=A0ABR5TEK5_9BURK|nr:HipA family kinase [Burkholderia savannae]KWZ43431.1 hypothetical protein WS72_11540 [Burkholderia savannae]KWZ46452.1 hypothetical protein WS73_20665 [Burkholderia savannae]
MINNDIVQIVEILGRAAQGRTRPFHCRGDDGRLYYVKGHDAGQRSLVSEWLASNMAKAFGLPIADFRVVEVPGMLKIAGLSDFDDLGEGLAFGSVEHENVAELTMSNIRKISSAVRQDIVVFDWWVRNEDRYLTDRGGNPNLLWDVAHQKVVVMDYNLAFDNTFNEGQFLVGHAFATDWNDVYQDWLARPAYELRMRQALDHFDHACDTMPDEWLEVGFGVPHSLSIDGARAIPERYSLTEFWNEP